MVLLRLDDGAFALAMSSESPVWRWPDDVSDPFTVMLYRANPDRSASREVTRMLDFQRRDALYKADLLPDSGQMAADRE